MKVFFENIMYSVHCMKQDQINVCFVVIMDSWKNNLSVEFKKCFEVFGF